MTRGSLILIPAPLGDNNPAEVLPQHVLDAACNLNCFVVEDVRTARRFLSRYGLKGRIDTLEFHELNEHTSPAEVEALTGLFDGRDVGLITEAGLPAVADPGSALVALCHTRGIRVIPLVGPSSLMLALMASGLNGQSFAFLGYIPAKTDERRAAIRSLERTSAQHHQTQIIIETPYRNDALLSDLAGQLSPQTKVCVAADLTLDTEFISTRTAAQWKRDNFSIGKRPCVFLVLA